MSERQTGAKPGRKRLLPAWTRPYRYWFEYYAFRLWAVLMGCFPVDANLVTARWMGRVWWAISPRHRFRTLLNLRRAYGAEAPRERLKQIARRSFEHWAQVFLVELVMSPRLITTRSWSQYIELGAMGPAVRLLLQDHSAIMLTPHFGNFELLGFALCRLGIPIVAVMRPLDNERLNSFLVQTRAASGLRLLYKQGATAEAENIVKEGTPLCFIADQDAGPKGYFVDFFGRKASTYKSIALLAMQARTPVIVGYAARTRPGFRYEIGVERIIQPEEWETQDDAPLWLTQAFSSAMESAIRRFPEQYLWVHRRWKSRPRRSMRPASAKSPQTSAESNV